ncbi:hypothetical protein RUM44_012312 [Polyplax serrata]|uniref:Uncharacterized protein n=1 Tax=Polyplax serrata TaxID=468196 RepID=A0ABR1BAZ1_POLSC
MGGKTDCRRSRTKADATPFGLENRYQSRYFDMSATKTSLCVDSHLPSQVFPKVCSKGNERANPGCVAPIRNGARNITDACSRTVISIGPESALPFPRFSRPEPKDRLTFGERDLKIALDLVRDQRAKGKGQNTLDVTRSPPFGRVPRGRVTRGEARGSEAPSQSTRGGSGKPFQSEHRKPGEKKQVEVAEGAP